MSSILTPALFLQAPHRKESETDHNMDTPLASQASLEHTDGLQDCSDVDVDAISDDDEDDVKVSPRSESPRGQCTKVSQAERYT